MINKRTSSKFFSLLFILSNIFLTQANSGTKTYGSIAVDEVVSVYDGDTFKVHIKDYPPIIGEKMSIRIYGIDAPEIRGSAPLVKKLAYVAKEYAKYKLLNATKIILKNIRRGKYFRIIAEVFVDGVDLGKSLMKAKLAKAYYGKGPRPKWTEEDYINIMGTSEIATK